MQATIQVKEIVNKIVCIQKVNGAVVRKWYIHGYFADYKESVVFVDMFVTEGGMEMK